MIHVAYRLWGGDGVYAKMLGVSMLSMFENTKEKVTVHIMHNDRLTADNHGKFCYIAGQYNQQIEFHNVEEISGPTLRKFENVYPDKTGVNSHWYPLIAHEVFPNLDKIICLGADTVFNSIDICELWNTELNEDFPFAAVAEYANGVKFQGPPLVRNGLVDHDDYFNADVFLFNPDFFRNNFKLILKGCETLYVHGYAYLFEQDTLNYLFSKKYQKLPSKFNMVLNWVRERGENHLQKAIYHFAGGKISKPSFDTTDIYNKLYLEYFLKTPWANAEMFGNLNNALEKMFKQIQNNSKDSLLYVANLLSKRSRAFLCEKDFQESVRRIFEVTPDELILNTEMGGEKIIQELNERQKRGGVVERYIILFVMVDDYLQARNFLLSQNFVEGVDFVNGFEFLSERHGLKFSFDSKPLLQAL